MDKNIDDLKHIRSMMERSTKFLSLSGMSGVSAGVFALAGSLLARQVVRGRISITSSLTLDLLLIAGIVLIAAVSSGFYFSLRKARKSNSRFWMPVTRQILRDFMIPMAAGGLFCFILMLHHCSFLIGSATLIFYGLGLIAAGARTYRDIKILGGCEIVLGFAAGLLSDYALLFWAIGFGVLHIIYGIVMYIRYDKKS